MVQISESLYIYIFFLCVCVNWICTKKVANVCAASEGVGDGGGLNEERRLSEWEHVRRIDYLSI